MSIPNLKFVWLFIHASILRNPGTCPRPSFRDLVLTLVSNQQLVLSIPQDAIETYQLAGMLGAPLEAGEKIYQDLQYTYVK